MLIKKIGIFFCLCYGLSFYTAAFSMDSSDEEIFFNPKRKSNAVGRKPSEELIISPGDSSQEDSLDAILRKLPSKKAPLKRKRDIREDSPSNDSRTTQSMDLDEEPDSFLTEDASDSGTEGSFIADGEHYGSDEEDLAGEGYYSRDGNESMSSSGEEYEPSPKRFKKDQRTHATAPPKHSQRLLAPKKKKRSAFLLPLPSHLQQNDTEMEEDLEDDSVPLLNSSSDFINEMVNIGLQVKLLSSVYLGNVNEKANIFLPRYKIEIEKPNGKIKTIEGWFKTEKDEICVFASGGLHYIWEKNVRHVHELFFKKKVKIIRAHWIQKHIYQDKKDQTLEEDFAGKKQKKLHSEFYYDLFFRECFIPYLKYCIQKVKGTLKSVKIDAFSWWDVCNKCEKKLSGHQDLLELLGDDISLSYDIAACKPYTKNYPLISFVEHKRVPYSTEQKAWKALWDSIATYTAKSFNKTFDNRKERKKFWTKTHEGLEVCKWLGQAFSEREIALDGKATSGKQGSMLSFYQEQQPEHVKALETLLSYLRDKNWDLSCWYKGPRFPDNVQPKWKRHWKQICVPHFGWEEVYAIEKKKEEKDKKKGRRPRQERQIIIFEDKTWEGDCEMCGYEGIENVYRIFHPKLHGSKKFLSLPEKEQKIREGSLGYTHETPITQLSAPLQKKRRHSLCVGSECVKILTQQKSDIEDWKERKDEEETDVLTIDQAERLAAYNALDVAEKGFKRERKKRRTIK